MSFVNVGAWVDGKRPASKKALNDAIKASPDSVSFDGTSMFAPGYYTLSTIPAGTTLSVTGPDPYTLRKWYANVTVGGGKVKVS